MSDTRIKTIRLGLIGNNITYPYKEVAAKMVTVPEPLVAAIGPVNTVVFAA